VVSIPNTFTDNVWGLFYNLVGIPWGITLMIGCISEWCIGKNLEGNSYDLSEGIASAWRGWRKGSVQIDYVPTKIWNQCLLKRSWNSEDLASWYIFIIKTNEMHYFSNLFLMKNSTCFGQIYCPSSGISTQYT
jgi:hypothetical protein